VRECGAVPASVVLSLDHFPVIADVREGAPLDWLWFGTRRQVLGLHRAAPMVSHGPMHVGGLRLAGIAVNLDANAGHLSAPSLVAKQQRHPRTPDRQ
jgi:hypothetical protein